MAEEIKFVVQIFISANVKFSNLVAELEDLRLNFQISPILNTYVFIFLQIKLVFAIAKFWEMNSNSIVQTYLIKLIQRTGTMLLPWGARTHD